MTSKFLLAAALAPAAAALAGPAAAAARPADLGDAVMSYNKARGTYCLTAKQAPTGTRLRTAVCRTAEQWKTEGLTVGRR